MGDPVRGAAWLVCVRLFPIPTAGHISKFDCTLKKTKTFYNGIVPMGFFPWEVQLPSLGKGSYDRVMLSKLQCMLGVLSVSIIHQTRTRTTGSLCAHGCKCVQLHMGVYKHHERVSTES